MINRFNKFEQLYERNIESDIKGMTIINVDIQPDYEKAFADSFEVYDWIFYLNHLDESNKIIFLYNGFDTLGMVTKDDYIYWLVEHGMYEETLERCEFYDKGYAFFRYLIDSDVEDRSIIKLVKFMLKHNITDSRDIEFDDYEEFITDSDLIDAKRLLSDGVDCIYLPDLMDYLKNKDNIILLGGAENECLKEVEISLNALGKSYSIEREFVY